MYRNRRNESYARKKLNVCTFVMLNMHYYVLCVTSAHYDVLLHVFSIITKECIEISNPKL